METYILRYSKFLETYILTTKENFESYVSDARKEWRFSKAQGFTDTESVLQYIERYFKLNRDQIIID